MAVEVTLLELIGQGRLALDMRLHHKGRIADRNVVATVVAGGLRVKTRTFATPSAAAKAVTGGEVEAGPSGASRTAGGWTRFALANAGLTEDEPLGHGSC